MSVFVCRIVQVSNLSLENENSRVHQLLLLVSVLRSLIIYQVTMSIATRYCRLFARFGNEFFVFK